MSPLVEKVREQVARIGRSMWEAGLVAGSYGNVSQRIPEEGLVVITPSGVAYDRMRPGDMVVIDMDGRMVDGGLKPSTETGLHLAVYRARSDVQALVHTHSLHASALAAARRPLPVILEEVAHVVGGPVSVADYAPSGSEALARSAARQLKKANAVILANHGVVGVGAGLDEALQVCQTVERAAAVYLLAHIVGEPVALGVEETASLRRFYVTAYGQREGRMGKV